MQAQDQVTTISNTTQTIATFVLVLVAASLISLVSVHFLDRGVNPIRDAVSDYGAREHAWFYRLAAIWLGFAGLLTAVMLSDAMFPKPTATILMLLVFAATRWAITIFPKDLEDEDATSTGRSHQVLAAVAFFSIGAAAAFFSAESTNDPFWDHAAIFLLGIFVPLTALLTGIEWFTERPRFGLIERLLYVMMFAWFSAVALIVLTA